MPALSTSAAAAVAAAAVLLCLPGPAEALSLQDAVGGLEGLIQEAGILGPIIFIVAYIAATVLLVRGEGAGVVGAWTRRVEQLRGRPGSIAAPK